MNKTLAVILALGMAVTMSGCMMLKDAAISVHDSIDEWLEGQTNVNTATEGPLATNTTSESQEQAPAMTYAKPASVAVDWTAKTLTPTGMGAGEIGTMTIIGRMADGRTGALDWPAWDATTGLWRIGMMTPVPVSNPAAELRGGDRNAPVIFKQSL